MDDFNIYEMKRSLSDFAWQAHVNPSNADKKINGFLLHNGEKWKDTFFYFDSQYNTAEFFDNKSGFTVTSDILEFDDKDKGVIWTGKEPEGRSWPALLDVGVMGHCTTCGTCRVGCYQKASNNGSDMSLEDYKRVIDEVRDHTFQVSLGGAGNCNFHKNFEEILQYTREQGLVPNYTTAVISDKRQLELTKKYCGAVAVSWHPKETMEGEAGGFTTCDVKFENDYYKPQQYTLDSIQNCLDAGITTNIHYVLSRESIGYATAALKFNLFPKGVNAVVFLRYKPVGLAKESLCLRDDEVDTFFKIIDSWKPEKHNGLMVGFDSCMVGLISKFCRNIDQRSLLPCEATRQSAYVSPDGCVLPCSFGNQDRKWYVQGSVKEAWDSQLFRDFQKCQGCSWVK